jgi:hypothetical protein
VREQWIRAKYERKEFLPEHDETHRPYQSGLKKGFLYKKKKVDNVWQSRFFTLDNTQLSYFRKITVSHSALLYGETFLKFTRISWVKVLVWSKFLKDKTFMKFTIKEN